MAMNNEGIIKELLKDVDFKKLTPEQITGQNGLIQQLTKMIIETAMNAEMTDHLGYEKSEKSSVSTGNYRNGKSSKKRAVTNERVTKIRELKRKGNAASVTKTDQKALPEEEKEEDINTYLPLNPPRQKRASKKFEPEAIELPDWLPETLWHEWVQFRQALRKPIRTEQGANGAIRELEKFRQQGFTPEQVIRHSIANEYQGLFAPKGVRPETLLRQVNTVSFPDSAIPPGFRG